jgi:hypothetical protein
MAVSVMPNAERVDPVSFDDATGYHVDEDNNLHVKKRNGNVAVFASGTWMFAEVES